MSELLIWLLATAVFQNVILTTGFGSSMLLRVLHKKSDVLKFGGILSFFLLATVLIDYPVDRWLGLSTEAKMLRPVVMVVIAALLYAIVTITLAQISVPFYKKIKPYVGPAAFNNLTIGLAMVANHKVDLTFLGTLGLALGTCLGFMLLGWLLLEGRSRVDTEAVPPAYRGVPLSFLFLGLTALALMGFSGVKLI